MSQKLAEVLVLIGVNLSSFLARLELDLFRIPGQEFFKRVIISLISDIRCVGPWSAIDIFAIESINTLYQYGCDGANYRTKYGPGVNYFQMASDQALN